uniref:Uncharacterized protein n=1 Tax=Trichuris muris TaxID=70415 RepID=A0A5S6Q8H3_TRIMR
MWIPTSRAQLKNQSNLTAWELANTPFCSIKLVLDCITRAAQAWEEQRHGAPDQTSDVRMTGQLHHWR